MTNNSFIEASDANTRLSWISGNMMDSGLNYFASDDYSTARASNIDSIPWINDNISNNVSTVWVKMPSIGRYDGGTVSTSTSGVWVWWLGSTTSDGMTWEMNHVNTGIPSGAVIKWAHFWLGRVSYEDTDNTHDMQLVYAPISAANGSDYFTGSETVWRPIINVTGDASMPANTISFTSHKVYDYAGKSIKDAGSLSFSGLPWLFSVRGASHGAGGAYRVGITEFTPSPHSGYTDGNGWIEIQYTV